MALDTGKAKDSLFGNIKKTKEVLTHEPPLQKNETIITKNVKNEEASQKTAKWQQFDKITALLTAEQKEGLDRVAKKLMKYRGRLLKKKSESERITANTLLRALVYNFLQIEDSMELDVLTSENDVCAWVSRVLNKAKNDKKLRLPTDDN
jgi:hypothetical protein